jgi:hypothetical protein
MLVIMLFSIITNWELLLFKSVSVKEIHLVDCQPYMSHRYVLKGISLAISSPANYKDVQQELIAEIH